MALSVEQVLAIAKATEAYDGVAPLDEATLLTLRNRSEDATIWGDVRGFGLLIGAELSLVVLTQHRGVGLGRQLLLRAPSLPAGTTAWSHGDNPAAAALAARHGWERTRELWVMRRPVAGLPPAPAAPDGIVVRSFEPGDEAELLRVNSTAFAHHPEQGGMTAADLAERMAEPWFDAAGLVTAWEGETLLAFHWTKRHSETDGEVYVVGVDPAAQSRGLGKLVTLLGLNHLASAGVSEIHLYVEGDNTPAVCLYEGLGFTRAAADTHIQYTRR
ncbi:mycothiol synthase [Nocardioides albus]|uniref:Mycothiol acetyltransferase n=1 Tax=Nocardioides albus TaxID=1841 RepID=A0A7W5A9A8_9ACTN|nr:mycothiol synthase [Nocardioides albus]MBB3091714.1 mycothiol synthase [Nocardioides albus]GGU44429.1 mycothiol acetyltransferase [Nocardioides albus]